MPAKLPSRLRRLDDALADLPGEEEPMLLTQLDGLVAGVALCPESIPFDEWLPCVWGEGGGPFEDAADAQQFAAMVTAHHDEVLRALARGRYQPLYEVDERNGDVLWDMWLDGFEQAMRLRPDSWTMIAESGDEAAAAALAGLTMLGDVARDESGLAADIVNELHDDAPEMIPAWVAALHAWRVARAGAVPSAAAPKPAKIGRNDPCTCGSGKKFKRCCGLN